MSNKSYELKAEAREQDAVDYFRWSALLQSLSAFETYRRLYRESVGASGVVDLMLLQEGNPRSLLTCTATAHAVLQTLAGGEIVLSEYVDSAHLTMDIRRVVSRWML